MNVQINDSLIRKSVDTLPKMVSDSLFNKNSNPIKVEIIENTDKIDWNMWFLLIAVLTLIASVFIPFAQKKYEEHKSKFGFHLYVKKRLGIVWNLLTYDKLEYKQPKSPETIEDEILTFDKYIYKFQKDFSKNKNTIHPLFAFGLILNFQNLLFTVKRIQYSLRSIDIANLDEKTLEYGDKLSKSEHHKLNGLFLLIEHYFSITNFHDKFGSLKSIKRKEKDSIWIGLEVDKKVLKKQKWILDDLEHLRENELSINEILNINKLLIQELKSYFEFKKLNKKRKNN